MDKQPSSSCPSCGNAVIPLMALSETERECLSAAAQAVPFLDPTDGLTEALVYHLVGLLFRHVSGFGVDTCISCRAVQAQLPS